MYIIFDKIDGNNFIRIFIILLELIELLEYILKSKLIQDKKLLNARQTIVSKY